MTVATRQHDDGAAHRPELLAAGTDLLERRRSGVSRGPIAALPRTDENARTVWKPDGAAVIGSLVTIAEIASDRRLAQAYPGLAAAAAGLATPQIRTVGTIGGNLAQRSRCWYYRNPHIPCLKKGGDACPARSGNHLYGVIFDLGPCVAPHPSTLGAALLAYDATVTTSLRTGIEIGTLFGDGRDGTRDHTLQAQEQILAINLPPPIQGERATYRRAISRTHAEWPLVEAIVRIVLDGDKVRIARVAGGGVAPVPLRLRAVEDILIGKRFDEMAVAAAAKAAATGAKPLPLTAYKVSLLEGLVASMLGGLRE
jgi:xanthine dehydrogenase YagS FAD-binding subunit